MLKQRRIIVFSTFLALTLGLSLTSGCEVLPGSRVESPAQSAEQSNSGSLYVALRGDFSQLRRTQAKITDIDHITIGIEASGVAPQSQTLTREQLADAGASAGTTFNSLPVGVATASVNVFDANNANIGSGSATATIYSRKTTTVSVTVQLVPTYVYASPDPGNLAAEITILDGPTITITPAPDPSPELQLSTFSEVSGVALNTARTGHSSVVIGDYLYVLGGSSDGNFFSSIERSKINEDGTLGSFSSYSGLSTARSEHASCVIGDYIYVFGGQNNSGLLNSVERASISASGDIGTFSVVPGVNLTSARRTHTTEKIGNYVYIVGGTGGSANIVQRASINADGTISTFSNITDRSLIYGRYYHSSAIIGDYLYVIGGTTYEASVERAKINTDGTLGNFSTVEGLDLVAGRNGHKTPVVGNYLYCIGGADAYGIFFSGGKVERALIDAEGGFVDFQSVPDVKQVKGRIGHTTAVIGDYLYVIAGSQGAGTGLTSIERATIQ